jgi:hypothetical protein
MDRKQRAQQSQNRAFRDTPASVHAVHFALQSPFQAQYSTTRHDWSLADTRPWVTGCRASPLTTSLYLFYDSFTSLNIFWKEWTRFL